MIVVLVMTVAVACDNSDETASADESAQDVINQESSIDALSNTSEQTTDISSEVDSSGASSAASSDNSSNVVSSSSNNTSSEKEESSKTVSNITSKDTPSNTSDQNSVDTSSNDTSNADTPSDVSEPDILRAIKVPKVYITTSGTINHDDYIDASINVVDPEWKYGEIEDNAGFVKIRGNSTSSGAKKPYNIKFSSKKNVLGLGKAKKWCLLANMYDKTMLRNKISFDFAQQIGMAYVPDTVFVEVYVNGKYMGNYLLTEAVEAKEHRVEIDPTGNEFLLEFEPWEQYSNPEWIRTPVYNILFGFNDPEQPTAEQRTYLNDFFNKAETALSSGDLNEVGKYFDLPSMVDFYIVNEYFKNVDFSVSSTRFYIKEGKIYGGPMWDFDLSAGNCSATYYKDYNNVYGSGKSTEGLYCDRLWYAYLFKCDGFLELVKVRYLELQPVIINLTTDNSLGLNQIDKLLVQYKNSFDDNYKTAGWSITAKYSEYERIPSGSYSKEIDYLRNWLIERNQWLLKKWGLK